jgi:superfamily II DNA/RNA helicase
MQQIWEGDGWRGDGEFTVTGDLLIATDLAARGLDIEQLTHVVNHNVPSAPEAYVHASAG